MRLIDYMRRSFLGCGGARCGALAAALLWLASPHLLRAADGEMKTFFGMCDASAAVALEYGFFAVGDDEGNVLRVYHSRAGEMPVQTLELSKFLGVSGKEEEADIEGAARIGQKAFWITSHGRNFDGKERPSRQKFFATSILATNGTVSLAPFGQPYNRLLADLCAEPRLKRFNLAAASRRAPKSPGGLNIEGLAATSDGHLLIGFRNPLPRGQALVVPLLNPDEMVKGGKAKLGEPVLLPLGGKGIRSIDEWHGQFLVVAGSFEGGGRSDLYLWNGDTAKPELMRRPYHGQFNPEALAAFPALGEDELLIISDDGNVMIAGKPCKKLTDPMQKRFRAELVPGSAVVPRHRKAAGSEEEE